MFTHLSKENKFQLYSIKEIQESNNKIVSSDFKLDFKSKSFIEKVFFELPILSNEELKYLVIELGSREDYKDMVKGFYMLMNLEYKRVEKQKTEEVEKILKYILR